MRKGIALFLTVVMAVSLTACERRYAKGSIPREPVVSQAVETETPKQNNDVTVSATPEPVVSQTVEGEENEQSSSVTASATPEPTAESTSEVIPTAKADRDGGIRPEFKEAMDSYEEFYREYCDLLKRYEEDSGDLTVLLKYLEMLSKMDEMTEKFEAWDEDDMSDEELLYYLEVNSRVVAMLLELGE